MTGPRGPVVVQRVVTRATFGGTLAGATLVLALACGQKETTCPSAARVPLHHRPSSSACPQQRAPETPEASTSCEVPDAAPTGPLCECSKDSDCTAGLNGRCGNSGGGPAGTFCSYDQCFSDSQCGDGGTVCDCRPSSASNAPNYCLASGNCLVDSDCGPGGYCSPSGIACSCFGPETSPPTDCGAGVCTMNGKVVPCECSNTCGSGYYCHTQCDACVDDSDCDGGASCNYDLFSKHWVCAPCVGPT